MAKVLAANLVLPETERAAYRPVPSSGPTIRPPPAVLRLRGLAERHVRVDDDALGVGVLVESYRGEELVAATAIDGARSILEYRAGLAARMAVA